MPTKSELENRASRIVQVFQKAMPPITAPYPSMIICTQRTYRNKDGSVALSDGFFYFMNPVDCGLRDEEHSVAEWLSEFNLQESEAWFMEWSRVIGDIAILIRSLEKMLSPSRCQQFSTLCSWGYTFSMSHSVYSFRSSKLMQRK